MLLFYQMNVLDKSVKKIVKQYRPEKIILFGSRVRGEQRLDSDYDLIIIKKTKKRFVRRALDLPNIDLQADFFIYTPEEFQRMSDSGNPFLESALKYHKVLYP